MTLVELEAWFCNFSLIASNIYIYIYILQKASNIFELTQFVFITNATFGFKNCHKDYHINFFFFTIVHSLICFHHKCDTLLCSLYKPRKV